MSRTYGRRVGRILRLSCLLILLPSLRAVAADPPLRYRLNVGDHLVYERRVRVVAVDDREAARRYTQQLQLWCLASRPDGTLQVLGELVRVADQQVLPARGVVFEMDRRGRRSFCPQMMARIADLDPLFEPLPTLPRPLEDDRRWLTDPDRFGRRWRCQHAGADSPADGSVRVDFELADPTGVAESLGQEWHGSYWFDARDGHVVKVESEWEDRVSTRRGRAVTRLHATLQQDSRWCERRIEELQRFLHTLRLEDRLLDQVTAEPARIEQILAHVERLWTELTLELSRTPESPLRKLAQARRARLGRELERYREQADLARQWTGVKAAHWSLQTPDSETIHSESLRDRIVVECFWSANSIWSLRSFDILRRLQAQLPAKDFRIVCLNIDADLAAARRASRLCGSGLTHVLAGSPVGGEPPRELPVFRVLDGKSRILRVYFGWQPALAEKTAPLGQ